MKNTIALLILSAITAIATPFYYQGYNSDGSPQTNNVLIYPWPPANGVTVYGTNIIFGQTTNTYTPSAAGYFSNSLYPNGYKVEIPAISAAFFVAIQNTTNFASLATYATNQPVVGGGIGTYQLVTNYLGYVPATNNPYTNTIVYVSGIVTNASGVATNVTLATNTIYYMAR